LPWNVDILLVSGGMKGVTVGSNLSFPGAGGAYSQANYSVSMFGAVSSGITEGKGKAIVSAAGYRYWPAAAKRRRIPQAFYDRIHAKVQPVRKSTEAAQQVLPATKKEEYPVAKKEMYHVNQKETYPAAAKEKHPAIPQRKHPGVRVSQELLKMAGFAEHQQVDHLAIK